MQWYLRRNRRFIETKTKINLFECVQLQKLQFNFSLLNWCVIHNLCPFCSRNDTSKACKLKSYGRQWLRTCHTIPFSQYASNKFLRLSFRPRPSHIFTENLKNIAIGLLMKKISFIFKENVDWHFLWYFQTIDCIVPIHMSSVGYNVPFRTVKWRTVSHLRKNKRYLAKALVRSDDGQIAFR